MAYQVYDYEGRPYLIWSDEDLPVEYTTIPPRSGMYYPVKFHEDTGEWEELGTPPIPPPINESEETNIDTESEKNIALLLYNDAVNTYKIQQLEDKITLLLPLIPEDNGGEVDE